jgi:hypothetical protein
MNKIFLKQIWFDCNQKLKNKKISNKSIVVLNTILKTINNRLFKSENKLFFY